MKLKNVGKLIYILNKAIIMFYLKGFKEDIR